MTDNLEDFPEEALAPLGIEAQHPDEFVAHLLDLSPGRVCTAVREQRLSLRDTPRSVAELLDRFSRLELAQTVAKLEEYEELL